MCNSLVASTNRGCKAISQGSGAFSTIVGDGITRAPCIQLPSAQEAAQVLLWIKEPANFLKLKESFESTTSFGKLIEASPTIAGRNVYVRLRCFSGDAMGGFVLGLNVANSLLLLMINNMPSSMQV